MVKIPCFDMNMFKSLIHTNKKIDTIAKFQYLQRSGKALTVLDGLDISEANYEAACDLLIKRYEKI